VKTLQVGTLNLNASGTLDLSDNDLVVDNGSFTAIQNWVISGFGTSGPGIISSTSDGTQIHALFDNALVGASDWNGGAIGANAGGRKYTYFGDATSTDKSPVTTTGHRRQLEHDPCGRFGLAQR
jgi:hypothetical protein